MKLQSLKANIKHIITQYLQNYRELWATMLLPDR